MDFVNENPSHYVNWSIEGGIEVMHKVVCGALGVLASISWALPVHAVLLNLRLLRVCFVKSGAKPFIEFMGYRARVG